MENTNNRRIIKSHNFTDFIVVPDRYEVVKNIVIYQTRDSVCFSYEESINILNLNESDLKLVDDDDIMVTCDGHKLITMSGFLKISYMSNEPIADVIRTFVESTMTILFKKGYVTINLAKNRTINKLRHKYSESVSRIQNLTSINRHLKFTLAKQESVMERKYAEMERDIAKIKKLETSMSYNTETELIEYCLKLLEHYGKAIYLYAVKKPEDSKAIKSSNPDRKTIGDLFLDDYEFDNVSEDDEILIKLSDFKKPDSKSMSYITRCYTHKKSNSNKLLIHEKFKDFVISIGKSKLLAIDVSCFRTLLHTYNMDVL
jgi:hypothetical protein